MRSGRARGESCVKTARVRPNRTHPCWDERLSCKTQAEASVYVAIDVVLIISPLARTDAVDDHGGFTIFAFGRVGRDANLGEFRRATTAATCYQDMKTTLPQA